MENKKLPSISDWIKESLKIYFKKENFIYLTKFALLGLLLQGVIMFLGAVVYGQYFLAMESLSPETFPEFKWEEVSPYLGYIIFGLILFIFFSIWIFIATFKALGQVVNGQKLGVGKTLKVSLSKVLPSFGLGILTIIIVLVGGLMLIIPGVIFFTWFYLAQYPLIIEGLGPIDALKRSKKVVEGFFWPVLGRILLMYGYFWLIGFLISLTLFPVVQIVIGGLIAPYFYLPSYLLYKDLSSKRPLGKKA